jgi:uncharacterized protein (TIGR02145 family)
MKTIFFLIFVCFGVASNAQSYLITFAGSGASSTVTTVKVENLTKGKTLTVNGDDILRLNISTGINSPEEDHSDEIKIYPNPAIENALFEIVPPVSGNAVVSVIDMTGITVAQISSHLDNFKQVFRLSGIKTGFYIINIKADNYHFTGKLLSIGNPEGAIRIEKVNALIESFEKEPVTMDIKSTQTTVDMEYSKGDRLKFSGTSGIYSSVKIDIPASDKRISFNFMSCTDGDNNNYPVIEIGTQAWMAENLKTTTYNNLIRVPLVTDPVSWAALPTPAYCWNNNDSVSFKEKYGALYNWYAADAASNGGKNLCPVGWHVPSLSQWYILFHWLWDNGYGYLGVPNHIAKSMAATTGWSVSSKEGTPGNDPASNNSSGFTGLPTGLRSDGDGTFYGGGAAWWSSSPQSSFAMGIVIDMAYPNLNPSNSGYFPKQCGISVRCLKGELILPVLFTSVVFSVTHDTAECGGIIVSDGGDPVIARGVCWSTSPNPIIQDNITTDGAGTGMFTSSIKWLTPGTTYYVRAYATNSSTTIYGNEIKFTTKVTDIDGNDYSIISIGTQVWMAENLKTTKFVNGDIIGTTVPSSLDIRSQNAPLYQWAWDGIENIVAAYGRLYTWYAVNDSRKLCPDGWHVPSDNEWTTLTDWLGGLSISGGKLKETANSHWLNPNIGATNETGFTALPGGYRLNNGTFAGLSSDGIWWSSSESNLNEAPTRAMGNSYANVNTGINSKQSGYSVRCLRDY